MTGSTLGLIIIPIVAVTALAAWLMLVFYADAHPAWRRQAPSGLGRTRQAGHAPARRPDESMTAAQREAEDSAEPGLGAERFAGTPPDKASAA